MVETRRCGDERTLVVIQPQAEAGQALAGYRRRGDESGGCEVALLHLRWAKCLN